jgi:hypothetical protein
MSETRRPDQPPPRAPGGQFAKPAEPEPGPARDTVWVACKMPNGLIPRLHRFEKMREPVMGGGTREVEIARPTGESVRVRGNTFPYGTVPNWIIEGGFGFTQIDKVFWDQWLEQNKELAVVKNRLLWAFPEINSPGRSQKLVPQIGAGAADLQTCCGHAHDRPSTHEC